MALLRKFGKIGLAHDVKRFETTLEPLQRQLEEKEMRICELEDFIVEQDEVNQFNYYVFCLVSMNIFLIGCS